jgi:ribosome biogenesis GTPase
MPRTTDESNPHKRLHSLGWNPFFEKAWTEWADTSFRPGRVAAHHRSCYYVAFGDGETRRSRVSGRFRHDVSSGADFPVVGDWVAVEAPGHEGDTIIRGVLARKSRFSRKVTGIKNEEQVLASNVDTVFLLMGLDGDYNQRRLERYLVVAHDSGAEPVVLLTKSDLSPDVKTDLKECKALAPGVPVYAICPLTGKGLKDVWAHLKKGVTAVLLGSSGVGKSTLLNQLLGEEVQATQEVRETDSQGRHTTTHRQMFRLDTGALLIDTPGLRELQLWLTGTGVSDAFPDIMQLGLGCRFGNCQHGNEPGCAVRKAVEDGVLSEERWESYSKLKKERAHIVQQTDWKSAREHRSNVKAMQRAMKKLPKRGHVEEELK